MGCRMGDSVGIHPLPQTSLRSYPHDDTDIMSLLSLSESIEFAGR